MSSPSPSSVQVSPDSTSAALASLTIVGGGVRSGKSRLAVELALSRGTRRAFVATAEPFDEEMRERIERHQAERGSRFHTVDAPRDLARVATGLGSYDVVLVDCLTLYISNFLMRVHNLEELSRDELRCLEGACLRDVEQSLAALAALRSSVIVVTNEVGMGIVPLSRLGRVFRDIAGRVNQAVAAQADEVWWCALGLPLRLKPSLLISSTCFGATEMKHD